MSEENADKEKAMLTPKSHLVELWRDNGVLRHSESFMVILDNAFLLTWSGSAVRDTDNISLVYIERRRLIWTGCCPKQNAWMMLLSSI